jgi:hypothetical protein
MNSERYPACFWGLNGLLGVLIFLIAGELAVQVFFIKHGFIVVNVYRFTSDRQKSH